MSEMRKCRAPECGKELRFVRTRKGKTMPVDPRPNAREGNVRLEQAADGVVAITLAGDELDRAREAGEPLYTSHFATCPQAKVFRGRKRTRRGVSDARGRVL